MAALTMGHLQARGHRRRVGVRVGHARELQGGDTVVVASLPAGHRAPGTQRARAGARRWPRLPARSGYARRAQDRIHLRAQLHPGARGGVRAADGVAGQSRTRRGGQAVRLRARQPRARWRRRPRGTAGGAAVDQGGAGRAQAPGGRALRAQGPAGVVHHLPDVLSDENSDEVVKKAVAHAMRHSTAQQASPAYDKERAERTWAAAVQVAGSYAARFK
eukprot:scaffold38672_cov57-Phaeocystis_antarctica.AAC.1